MPQRPEGRSRAVIVASGILLSRVAGFLRDRAIAHFFGVGGHADVFRTALRGPNILQNLLGEGTISAAFIPVYTRLLDEGRREDAGRFAGAIFGLLLATAALVSVAGMLLARPIVSVLAPGFLADAARVAAGELDVDRFPLAVSAVKIIFPMTGILVLSAWALGVLNSHRRFLLPYLAPVLWNAAIIAALVAVGADLVVAGPQAKLDRLLLGACVGALVGGFLQFVVQLPLVLRLLRGFRPSVSTRVRGVREALAAFGPVVAGRGVYQLSAYLDLLLASLLAAGAVGALGWAQSLYVLPVSLFGLSVAAAELPELSRRANETDGAAFEDRVRGSLRQMTFFVLPSTVVFLLFGFPIVGALYRTGSFSVADNWLVYLVLAGYAPGLPATTWSRLLQNAYYARGDTRTPARIAAARVLVSAAIAVPLMLAMDRVSLSRLAGGAGEGLFLGAVGLAAASVAGAWVELLLLVRGRRDTSRFRLPWAATVRMSLSALGAAVPAALAWWFLPSLHVIAQAAVVMLVYGLVYLGIARSTGSSELTTWLGKRPSR